MIDVNENENLYGKTKTDRVKFIVHPSGRSHMDDRAIIHYLIINNNQSLKVDSTNIHIKLLNSWSAESGIRCKYIGHVEDDAIYKYDEFVEMFVPGVISFQVGGKSVDVDFEVKLHVPAQPNQDVIIVDIGFKESLKVLRESKEGTYYRDKRKLTKKENTLVDNYIEEFELQLRSGQLDVFNYELVTNY